ncbi:hypothetical protein [Bowmanella denitrificans]|uniref:hypothetical protein n=1 Tax=Bowmanella denitrificans TaxID=366582 RepID=UPI000C9B2B84|nr:hypothetical protein [Bowmanella denitrificans]
MAQRKTCTKAEVDAMNSLAHAFVIEDIAKDVMEPNYPEQAEAFRNHMRSQFPQYFRVLDELREAIPRLRKEFSRQIARDGWGSVMPKDKP